MDYQGILIGALLASAFASAAAAQSPADEEARTRFRLGQQYYDQGRFTEAAEEFERAYAASPREALLYNMYVAHRDAGNIRQAANALRRYLETDAAVEASEQNLRARLEALEAQLAAGQEHAPPASRDAGMGPVPYIVLGSGGALLVASLITGIVSLDQHSQIEALCPTPTTCEPGYESVANEGQALSIATDVLWVTGAIAAGVGLTLLVIDLTSASGGGRESLQASCGPLGCSIRGEF